MFELLISFIIFAISLSAFILFGLRRVPFAIWSPVYILPLSYAAFGVGGYFYYRFSSSYLYGFYDLAVTQDQLALSLAGFLIAIAAFLLGVSAYVFLSKKASIEHRLRKRLDTYPSSWWQRRSPMFGKASLSTPVWLLIPLILTVVGSGLDNIWWREEYLVYQYRYFLIAGSLLSLPAVLYLGAITTARRSAFWRASCAFIFSLYMLVYLAMSTRRIVVNFLFYIAGLSLGRAPRKAIVFFLALWVLTLPLLLQIPLELRGMSHQGLGPLFNNLLALSTGTRISTGYLGAVDAGIRNLTFGVPLAGYVGSLSPIPKEVLLSSLNPLPSFIPVPGLPPWESFRESLRATKFIPYNALGELLNYGWFWLTLFYFLVGLLSAWLNVSANYFQGQRSRFGYIIGCGLLLLFTISSTQYNLRSVARLLWYAVAIAVTWKFISRIRLNEKSQKPSGSTVGRRALQANLNIKRT